MREKSQIEQHDEIDQSLYSRMILKKETNEVSFFGLCIGLWDEVRKKKVTGTDTNMWCSGVLVSGQEFLIEGVRFREAFVNKLQREHLLQYAYCIIRVADRDYFIYPLHLMENYFFYLERKLTIPILLQPMYNFQVLVRLDQPYDVEDIKMTCELIGRLRRPQ